LNAYHVSMIAYVLEQLRATPDGDGTLLDDTLLLYGSPMGDSNLHNHKRVPFFIAGGAGGALTGGLHLKAPDGTPLANGMLTVLRTLGLGDLESFGDSTGPFPLSSAWVSPFVPRGARSGRCRSSRPSLSCRWRSGSASTPRCSHGCRRSCSGRCRASPPPAVCCWSSRGPIQEPTRASRGPSTAIYASGCMRCPI